MKIMTLAAAPALVTLVGCIPPYNPPASSPSEPLPRPAGKCDANPAQSFVGQSASPETGAAILEASGARSLRWGPPDSAWTMDYREDRVNVRYGRDMVITTVTCG